MRNLLAGAVVALTLAGCAPAPVTEPLTGLSDEEEQLYAQSYALRWSGIEVGDAPSVDVVAYIPSAGWGTAVSGCMNAAGYADYTATPGGMTYPARNDADEERALYTCIGRYPVQADFSSYANKAQLEYLYDYFRDSLIPCLAAEGYVVPGQAPTREQFSEFTVQPRWNPYNALLTMPTTAVRERCPASPFAAGLTVRY
jgi:hypothetical protein